MTHSIEARRAANDLAAMLEAAAANLRSGHVPPWVVLNVAPSVQMVAHIIQAPLKAAAGARPMGSQGRGSRTYRSAG